jgi:hypothetical protein
MQVDQEVRAVEKSKADVQSPKVLVSFSRKSEALTQVYTLCGRRNLARDEEVTRRHNRISLDSGLTD